MKYIKRTFFILAIFFAVGAACCAVFPATRFGTAFFGIIAAGCALETLLLIKSKKNKFFRIISIVGIALFIFFIVSFLIIQGIIQNGMHEDNIEADYIFVLGAQVMPDKRPSATLASRLNRTEIYLKEYPKAKAVLCGGKGDNEPISEAEAMKQYLLNRGISEDRLILESKSRNTIQNIENAKKLLDDTGKNYTTIVISSDFHCARARRLMENAELSPAALPSYTPYLSQRIISRCREYCSILGLMVSGRW